MDLPDGYEIVTDSPAPLPEGYEVVPEKKTYGGMETVTAALSNFLPSLYKNIVKMGEGAVEAVTNPVGTYDTLAKLMITTSPLAPDMRLVARQLAPLLSEEQNARVKKGMDDLYAPREALLKEYVEKYGGWDNFQRTAAEDPAALLMDLSTVLTGPQMALAKAPGTLGKVGKVAGTVADTVDPISMGLKGISKVAEPVLTETLGVTTGVGPTALREAYAAGKEGGDAGINFRKAFAEGMPMDDIIATAKKGVQTIRDRMMAAYRADKDVWDKHQGVIDFTPIDRAATNLVGSMQSKAGSGHSKLAPPEQAKLQKLTDVVDEWQRDPASHTIEGIDALKQRLSNEVNFKTDHPQIVRAATALSNAARDAIMKSSPPKYRKAMKDYTEASRLIEDLEQSFSLGRTGTAQAAMSKLQSLMRNNANTQYGVRAQKMNRLQDESGIDIMPALSGHALSSWSPRGIGRGVLGGSAPLAGAAAFTGAMGPGALAAGAAGLAATSPKFVGGAYHNAGRLVGLPQGAFRLSRNKGLPGVAAAEAGADAVRGAFSRPGRLGFRALDEALDADEEQQPYARGGHFARH